MNARTKLTLENSVDVQSCKVWVVSKKFVDGLPDTCESGGSILKLQQLLDAKELTSLEDRLVLMVYNDVAIRSVRLAEPHQADAELSFHMSSKFFLVGRDITVLLQDSPQLSTAPVIRFVFFQCMLHDKLHLYRTQLFTVSVEMNHRLLFIVLALIAQTLHDGTELGFGSISISKCVFSNVVDIRFLPLTSIFLHDFQRRCS